jgi:hypothetical protein
MAVPNRDSFELQDVVNEVNPTTDDLQDCFNDAEPLLFDSNYNNDTYAPANSLKRFRNYNAIPPPNCTNEIIVFQICNSNSAKDDNYDVYFNGIYIGNVDLNSNSQVGSVFIGNTDPTYSLSDSNSDFPCGMVNMDVFKFEEGLVASSNEIKMVRTQLNNNFNYGTFGVRSYVPVSGNLTNPYVIADFDWGESTSATKFGGTDIGGGYVFTFDFTVCPTRFDLTAPTAPSNLSVVVSNYFGFYDLKADLSWTASTDNVDVVSYVIELKKNLDPWIIQGTVSHPFTTGTVFLDSGNTYQFRVKATDANNNQSSYSNIVTKIT